MTHFGHGCVTQNQKEAAMAFNPERSAAKKINITALSDFSKISWNRAEKIMLHFRKEYDIKTEESAVRLIKENPYKLCNVKGIGFKTADYISLYDLALSADDPARHYHGNKYLLFEGSNNGVLPLKDYRNGRKNLGLINPELEHEGVTLEAGRVWDSEEYKAERILANYFSCLGELNTHCIYDSVVDERLKSYGCNEEQRQAVHLALSGKPLMALTGGAGTGKSFTIASIAKEAVKANKKVAAMAFSGKAADRVKEALEEADVSSEKIITGTIHKVLGLHDGIELSKVTEDKEVRDSQGETHTEPRLDADIIILDESSMIHNWLLACVIEAKKPSASIILVGDPEQLPPVGHGNPFTAFIEQGMPRVHLEENYRQKDEQDIFLLGTGVLNEIPYTPQSKAINLSFGDPSWRLVNQVIETIKDKNLLDWQVVTWTNKTKEQANKDIQALLNPRGEPTISYISGGYVKGVGYEKTQIRIGDKILVRSNDYNYNVFNGQVGILESVSRDEDNNLCVDVKINDSIKKIPFAVAEDLLQLGYCITCHKSQGSGWNHVILYQPFAVALIALPKRFYYTAITRAKNKLNIFTGLDRDAFWRNATQLPFIEQTTLSKRIEGKI